MKTFRKFFEKHILKQLLVTRLFDRVAGRFISLDDFYLAYSLENRVQWRLTEVDLGVFAFCEPF